MSEEAVSAEGLFQDYWSSVSGGLSSTLSSISNSYAQADYANAAKRAEIANTLASQYEYFSTRAAELSKSADQAGLDMKKSAQNALDSASLMFRQQAEALRTQGLDAFSKVNADLLSGLNRELLAKTGGVLGPLGDVLDIGLKSIEGDYYGAAGAFIGAVAGAALAAALVGLTGWISIPLAIGFSILTGESFESLFNYLDPLGINSDVNTNFDLALKTASPIVLDLDGDGIETFGADGQVLFDHDGDGDKHGTGWVKSDDGLLVLDRNGNGTIDNGLELFGENTLLADGSKARDGFEAMQAVDQNGDGKLDANDAVWADLRVWRDMNGDGISQNGELFTLADLGIKSIGTGSDGKKQNLGNNNHVDGFGTFEWDENRGGGTGVSGDVYFEDNQFYREFGESIEIPSELTDIANMRGSGAVRDLREAAVTSASLRDTIVNYSQAETRSEQQALLNQLVNAWAGSASFRTFDERVEDLGEGKFYNVEFSYTWDIENRIPGLAGGGSSGSAEAGGLLGDTPTGWNFDKDPTAEQLKNKELLEMVRVLEVFNNQYFFEFQSSTQNERTGLIGVSYKAGAQSRSGGARMPLGNTLYLTEEDFSFGPQQEANIRKAYQALLDSVYDGLLLQTRLKPYMDAVSITIGEDGVSLDFSAALEKLEEAHTRNPVKAIVDMSEFASMMAGSRGWATNEIVVIGEWVRQLDSSQLGELQQQLGADQKVIIDTETGTTLQGGARSDFLFGEGGNDYLYGNAGADFLDGGEGSDRLYGGDGNDILYGGAGNDTLNGDAGNDVLEGGAGNDTLNGGVGSDIYRFGRGWGQDTLNNYDTSANKVDAIVFAEDIVPDDIVIARSGTNLILSLKDSTDKITVSSYFSNDGTSAYRLEEIRFADGTTWSIDQVKVMAIQSTDGNDTLTGYATDDHLSGGLGDDSLYGEAGNDLLDGGEGNDRLYGGNGDDTLIGGAGNDTLNG
ncbi:calcium-binding protein, partial [Pseudomonas lopnurensis]|uniref:calcium-binding protein n=1 Tax=Pseudomonas lopnurensis TaxID=1477517 RepID=UPI002E28E00B